MHALGAGVALATENNVSLKPVLMWEHLPWPHLLHVTPDPAKAVSGSCPSGSCFGAGIQVPASREPTCAAWGAVAVLSWCS